MLKSEQELSSHQLPQSVIKQRRLKLFGHVARADQAEDPSHALKASLNLPANWR